MSVLETAFSLQRCGTLASKMATSFALVVSQGWALPVELRDDLFLPARESKTSSEFPFFRSFGSEGLSDPMKKISLPFSFLSAAVTARGIVKACCIFCGFCIRCNLPTFPLSPEK